MSRCARTCAAAIRATTGRKIRCRPSRRVAPSRVARQFCARMRRCKTRTIQGASMNESTKRSLRERLPLAPGPEGHFRWRGGGEISRVEGFTDAVFAFAVTLLVVALEGPRTFEGLLDVVRGFPAFIICFTFLMIFWNAHFRYHRRYGLEDVFTRVLTMAILVLVLFFVYPL